LLQNYRTINQIHADYIYECTNAIKLEIEKYLGSQPRDVDVNLEFGVYGTTQMYLICMVEMLVADDSQEKKEALIDPLLKFFDLWLDQNDMYRATDVHDSSVLRRQFLKDFKIDKEDSGPCAEYYSSVMSESLSELCMDKELDEEINQICRKHVGPFIERIKTLKPTYEDIFKESGYAFNVVPSLNPDAQIAAISFSDSSEKAIDTLIALCNNKPDIILLEDDIKLFGRELMYYLLFSYIRVINNVSKDEMLRDFSIVVTKWKYESSPEMHTVLSEEIKAYDSMVTELGPEVGARIEEIEDGIYLQKDLFELFDSFRIIQRKVGVDLFYKVFYEFLRPSEIQRPC